MPRIFTSGARDLECIGTETSGNLPISGGTYLHLSLPLC